MERPRAGSFVRTGLIAGAAALGGALAASGAFLLRGDRESAPAAPVSEPLTTVPAPSDSEPVIVDPQIISPGSPTLERYVAAQQRAIADLPAVFLTDDQAEARGLAIVPNGYDNRRPAEATAIFRYPLPGQTPRSAIVSEFFAARFLVGRAQSYQSTAHERQRFGIVVWAFEEPAGARRAFRALRDLSGREWHPSGFAPQAALIEDFNRKISDVLWVHGPLVIRAGYAVQDGIGAARETRDALARLIDEQAGVFAPPDERAIDLPSTDATLYGRLATLKVPDDLLPGGLSTYDRSLGGSLFTDLRGSSIANSPVADAFMASGFVGGQEQIIKVAARQVRYGLYAYAFDSPEAAGRALRIVRDGAEARVRAVRNFPGAVLVSGPNGDGYSDLYWTRGPLLLRAGIYSSPDHPLSPQVRDRLARMLDARSARFLRDL